MNDAKQAITRLTESGIQLSVNFRELLMFPSSRLTPELRRLAIENKTGIIEILLSSKTQSDSSLEQSGRLRPRRGIAAHVTLDGGRSFTLVQPGGDAESISQTIQQSYGDQVKRIETLDGAFGVLKEHRKMG